MRLYFEVGEVIKTNETYNSKIVCQKKGSRTCGDCFFIDQSDHFCDSVACEGSERLDSEEVLFLEVNEEKGGEK